MESKCDFNAQFIFICMKSIEKAKVEQIVKTSVVQMGGLG